MKHTIRAILLNLVLPVIVCVVVGGMVGWGYRYAGGSSLGKYRSGRRTPKLTWTAICKRKKDIKRGAIAGGFIGLAIMGLTFQNTVASMSDE